MPPQRVRWVVEKSHARDTRGQLAPQRASDVGLLAVEPLEICEDVDAGRQHSAPRKIFVGHDQELSPTRRSPCPEVLRDRVALVTLGQVDYHPPDPSACTLLVALLVIGVLTRHTSVCLLQNTRDLTSSPRFS